MPVQSANEDVKVMLQDAVLGVQAACASGREATSRIEGMATHPALKEALKQGSKYSESWRERMEQTARTVGAGEPATESNPIIEAIQQVGGKIMHKAKDATARDLGIIASGQLALHYYISAFGTMSAYAKLLGMEEAAQSIHACLDEAKRGDERYTELAAEIGG